MAASVSVKPAAVNPCCQAWKDKCLKSEEARVALRKTISILQSVVNKFEADNARLKEAYQDEQARAVIEKESREKESSTRALLENEVSVFKSEIAVLQAKIDASDENEELKLLRIRVADGEKEITWLKEVLEKEKLMSDMERKTVETERKKAEKDKIEKINLLEVCVSEGEKEISQLKELVGREKLRADAEKKIAEAEKKRAIEWDKFVKAEKDKAYEERKAAQIEEKMAEDYQMQLEALRNEASEAKSELLSETSKVEDLTKKLEVVTKKLEAEKQKTIKQRKRADSEMAKAKEQKKLAEVNMEKAKEELLRAENLSMKLEDARQHIKEQQKEMDDQKAIINKTEKAKADEEMKAFQIEGKEAEEQGMKLEALRSEAREAKSKLLYEISKLEEVTKKLEAEKETTIKERKRADYEMAKVEEQRKLAEVYRKKAEEEQLRAENLSLQLEEARQNIKEQERVINDQQPVSKKAERVQADEEIEVSQIDENKSEDYKKQLEALRNEASEAKTKLLSETSKLEEVTKKLEAEKQRTMKERKRAYSEMVKAEEQRNLAEVNGKKAEEEQSHAENFSLKLEEARRANMELQKKIDGQKAIVKKAEDCRVEFEALRKEASEAKSELLSRTSKLEEVMKKLEAEKQKTIKERKRADSEMAKAEEQRKLAEVNKKKADEEQLWAGNLSLQLEKARRVIEELQKEIDDQKAISKKEHAESDMVKMEEQKRLAEINRREVMEEKCRADCLSEQLKEARLKIEDMQKQICELAPSRRVVETFAASPDKDRDAEIAKMKIMKKELKLEKMRVKHAKTVAKMERYRNNVLQEELSRLKLEFVQFSYRLTLLDSCFSPRLEGINDLEKAEDLENVQLSKLKKRLSSLKPFQMHHQKGNELQKPSCNVETTSDPHKKGLQCSEMLTPTSRGNYCESISASFSDRHLAGSQDKGAFSVTTSTKMPEQNPTCQQSNSSMSGEEKMQNENLAIVADNCVRSSSHINVIEGVNGHSKKRKRMLDTIESIGSLCSKNKKWHLQIEERLSVLHDMLDRKADKPVKERSSVPNLLSGSHGKDSRVHKKRKASHEAEVVMKHVDNSDKLKIGKLKTVVQEDSNRCGEAFQPANNLIGAGLACREAICDSVANGLEGRICFEEAANGDYMKLLELENASDEEYYKKAMEMPLSPTLPEIGFQHVEDFFVDNLEPLMKGSSLENGSKKLDSHQPSCSIDVINGKLDSNNLNSNGSELSCNSLLDQNKSPLGSFGLLENNCNGFSDITKSQKTWVSHKRNSEMEMEMSVIPGAGDDGMKILFGNELGYKHTNFPKYFVSFSNIKDQSTTTKIFHATKTCMNRCALVTQTGWAVKNILLAMKEENLLVQEKACVFFSLLLQFSVTALGKYGSFINNNFRSFLDAFHCHLSTVMYDAEGRSMIADMFHSILSLIGDFLSDGRIVYADRSSETHVRCDSKINVFLDGMNLILSKRLASADLLVAGSVILASLCAASDQIGFICEVSCNMLLLHAYDTSVLLTILHIFAYLGRQRFFTLRSYSLIITVLKSVVTYLEKGHLDVTMEFCHSSTGKVQSEFHLFATCPFSEGAVSVDSAIFFLVETLQNYAQFGTMNQGEINTVNAGLLSNMHKTGFSLRHEDVDCSFGTNCDTSCSLSKYGVHGIPSEPAEVGTLCHFTDVLSLVELVAANMGWDWIQEKIVPPLFKILESSMVENLSVAIVILLGQLGRRAVDAGGCKDKDVEDLTDKLAAFLQQEATIRGGLPIQIATVSALLRLLSLDFNQVMESQVAFPVDAGLSDTTDLIRKWFSLLSKEQQAFLPSLLQYPGLVTPEQM